MNEVKDATRQPGGEIRPEIERAVLLDAPREIDARIFFGRGELDVRIGFVVAEQDVEFRAVFFDEVVLERQGFALVADHDSFEIDNFARQGAGLGIDRARLREIGAHAAAQVARFANVQHCFRGVFEKVHTGIFGKLGGFFARLHGEKQRSAIDSRYSVIILDSRLVNW